MEDNMNRRLNREKAMHCVYQYLIMERNVDELIELNMDVSEINEDRYIVTVIRQACENVERYSNYINNVLNEWSFERLGMIEQALLLCGCAEFDLKQIEMAIIIDENVRLAKKYCDSDSYKLINGVLEKI